MEIFLKRAEKAYIAKIDEEKTYRYFADIKRALKLIPSQFSRDMGSEIPRLLFKISQTLSDKSSEATEGILKHILIFTQVLTELTDNSRTEIHQVIMKQSQNQYRSLLDLMIKFVEKAEKGEFLENESTFENILIHVLGVKTQVTEFKDTDLFIKRAEKQFFGKIGQTKAIEFSENIILFLKEIDDEIQSYMSSEIAKYLFKFSQNINDLTPETLERVLKHILLFIKAISDLGGKTIVRINQDIIRRSKKKLRGLIELFKAFLEDVRDCNEIKTEDSTLEDIINYVCGMEDEYIQFTDIGGFLKRAEKIYAEKISKEKASSYIDHILNLIPEIPVTHRSYIGSDIAKFLLTYSEKIKLIEPEDLEKTLSSTISFLYSIKELDHLNQEEINKSILLHSNQNARNLIDLYKIFLKKSKESIFKVKEPTFNDILLHTFGLQIGPKIIEEAPPIHELMINSHERFPVARDHEKWGSAIFKAIPRYLEILPNKHGDKILNELWDMTFPMEHIIPKFQDKVAQLPRTDEKPFISKLLNLLSQQILIDETLDRALTGSVAYIMLARVFIEIFSGKNATIRALKIRDHLEERKSAKIERKNDIDYNIQKILEEDFKAIYRKSFILKTIMSIVSNKEYFIKITDLVEEDYPEELVEVYTSQNAVKPIGKQYLDSSLYGEIVIALKFFLKHLDYIKAFYDNFIHDFLTIPLDAKRKLEILKDFFMVLLDLRENLEPNKFYSKNVEIAEHQVYYSIIKYLYELLLDIFKIVFSVLEQKEESFKIVALPKYLSDEKYENNFKQIQEIENEIKEHLTKGFTNDSDKIKWLKSSLEHRKADVLNFQLIKNLLMKIEEIKEIFLVRMEFSKTMINFLIELKKVHRNLPAAFSQFVGNIEMFDKEIDNFIEQIKNVQNLGFILPSEFETRKKRGIEAKQQLYKLKSNQIFIEQIKELEEINQKNISFSGFKN